MYLSHTLKEKKNLPLMKSDNTFINILCGAQPPIPILTRFLYRGGDSNVCVCVCVCACLWVHICVFADVRVPFQYVFMVGFEDGETF